MLKHIYYFPLNNYCEGLEKQGVCHQEFDQGFGVWHLALVLFRSRWITEITEREERDLKVGITGFMAVSFLSQSHVSSFQPS